MPIATARASSASTPVGPMVAKARQHCADTPSVTIIEDDARNFEFEPTDLIISYYTIQFIPPRDRQKLFDKLYNALNWGGALIMFEKVRAPDARFQDMMVGMYNEFKLDQGFDYEEIVTKTRSLKGVLEAVLDPGQPRSVRPRRVQGCDHGDEIYLLRRLYRHQVRR
jgi:trans-aconitate methyltransferase